MKGIIYIQKLELFRENGENEMILNARKYFFWDNYIWKENYDGREWK